MNQVIRRNKNAGKTLIDYDLNIYMLEDLDQYGTYYHDPANWWIQVYIASDPDSGWGHDEFADPFRLTAEEIVQLGLNQGNAWEADSWYGLDGFRHDYWDKMSDRLKKYFDELPKYYEDMIV